MAESLTETPQSLAEEVKSWIGTSLSGANQDHRCSDNMKIAILSAIMVLQSLVAASAGDKPTPTAMEKAENDYLRKVYQTQEDYLNAVRLAVRETTIVEVFLIGFPGKEDLDPFEEGVDRGFVEPHSGLAFKILKSARIDDAAEVTAFLKATLPDKSLDMLMFPYVPSIGFRCFAGESELFAATIDLKSKSMKIVFPDKEWTRLGIDVDSAIDILADKGLQHREVNKAKIAAPNQPSK